MYISDLDSNLNDGHAVHCANGRICTSQCISKCQTKKPMKPEDMVQYGWTIDAAKEKQASSLGKNYQFVD